MINIFYYGKMNRLHINQLKVVESFINGENIFMSGPGGTVNTLSSVQDYINTKKTIECSINWLCRFIRLCRNYSCLIGVGITKETDINYIRKLKKTKNI